MSDREPIDTDTESELLALAERTRQRFEDEEITEDDLEDAIARARSE